MYSNGKVKRLRTKGRILQWSNKQDIAGGSVMWKQISLGTKPKTNHKCDEM